MILAGLERYLSTLYLYHDLGKSENERRECYRKYVLTERPYEEFIDQGILGADSRPSRNRY